MGARFEDTIGLRTFETMYDGSSNKIAFNASLRPYIDRGGNLGSCPPTAEVMCMLVMVQSIPLT